MAAVLLLSAFHRRGPRRPAGLPEPHGPQAEEGHGHPDHNWPLFIGTDHSSLGLGLAPSVAPSYFTSGLGAPPSLTAVGLSAWLLLDVEYPHLHGGEGAGEWVLRIPLRRGGVLLGILCVFLG